mmetsp:Transcript_51427/g.159482  ORF Transcript_51427/g.159482 Transcript_51427/m.159482 type:complete len:206 (+) Transcript_51427:52-669(+)
MPAHLRPNVPNLRLSPVTMPREVNQGQMRSQLPLQAWSDTFQAGTVSIFPCGTTVSITCRPPSGPVFLLTTLTSFGMPTKRSAIGCASRRRNWLASSRVFIPLFTEEAPLAIILGTFSSNAMPLIMAAILQRNAMSSRPEETRMGVLSFPMSALPREASTSWTARTNIDVFVDDISSNMGRTASCLVACNVSPNMLASTSALIAV